MAVSEGPWTEILSAPKFRVSTPVDRSSQRNPRDFRALTATMKQPVLGLVNVIAWVWLAVSVFRWLERLSLILGATLEKALRF